jgi:hypothetical protein
MKRSVRVAMVSIVAAASLGLAAGPAFASNSQGQDHNSQGSSNSQGSTGNSNIQGSTGNSQ